MKSHNTQPLKEVLNQLLKSYNLDKRLDEFNIVSSWEKIMGKSISRHTTDISVKNGKLLVKLDSAALRHELTFAKGKIIELVNEYASKEVIKTVEIR